MRFFLVNNCVSLAGVTVLRAIGLNRTTLIRIFATPRAGNRVAGLSQITSGPKRLRISRSTE